MVGNWCLKTHTIQIRGSHRACSQVGVTLVTLVTLVTCSSSLSLHAILSVCGMVGNWCLKTHTIQILGSHRACSQVGVTLVTLVTLVTCSSSLSLRAILSVCGMVGNWCLKTHTIQILGSHQACSQVGVTLVTLVTVVTVVTVVTLVTCSSSLSLHAILSVCGMVGNWGLKTHTIQILGSHRACSQVGVC